MPGRSQTLSPVIKLKYRLSVLGDCRLPMGVAALVDDCVFPAISRAGIGFVFLSVFLEAPRPDAPKCFAGDCVEKVGLLLEDDIRSSHGSGSELLELSIRVVAPTAIFPSGTMIVPLTCTFRHRYSHPSFRISSSLVALRGLGDDLLVACLWHGFGIDLQHPPRRTIHTHRSAVFFASTHIDCSRFCAGVLHGYHRAPRYLYCRRLAAPVASVVQASVGQDDVSVTTLYQQTVAPSTRLLCLEVDVRCCQPCSSNATSRDNLRPYRAADLSHHAAVQVPLRPMDLSQSCTAHRSCHTHLHLPSCTVSPDATGSASGSCVG